MSTRTSRNEQRRADDFEGFVQQLLKALGYIQIEEHPKIGTKRADLLVTSGEGRFFVEAKSPHLMRGTPFDPDHFAQVIQLERDMTCYVKKQFGRLRSLCSFPRSRACNGRSSCRSQRRKLRISLAHGPRCCTSRAAGPGLDGRPESVLIR